MTKRTTTVTFALAVAVMAGIALVGQGFAPASATQPPGSVPAPLASPSACPVVGRLENIGYTVAALGKPPVPTRLGVSHGLVLWVQGGVPVAWVGRSVAYCPDAEGKPGKVCIEGRCTVTVPAPGGRADAGPINRGATPK